MINLSSIYANPILPPKLYLGKCLDVEVKRVGDEIRCVQTLLKIGPQYDLPARGTELTSIIHVTPRSQYLLTNFYMIFRCSDDPRDAINRWGVFKMVEAQYAKTKYGLVVFADVAPKVIRAAMSVEADEKRGKIKW